METKYVFSWKSLTYPLPAIFNHLLYFRIIRQGKQVHSGNINKQQYIQHYLLKY